MFNVSISLSDRLKAAVNQLEATGTSLQARAIGQQQHQNQSSVVKDQRPTSPTITTSAHLSRPGPSPSPLSPRDEKPEVSPTRSSPAFITSPSALAENALSGLSGLRKNFSFNRASQDGGRPSLADIKAASASAMPLGLGSSGSTPQHEPKDVSALSQPAPGAGPSRSVSPARLLGAFGVGSDPSTMNATPVPQSPLPGPSHLRSPQHAELSPFPPPDPSDPATYPLPPSPVSTPTPLLISATQYADPLGASPAMTPADYPEPPAMTTSLPIGGDRLNGLGLGALVGADEAVLERPHESTEKGQTLEHDGTANGKPPEMDERYDELSQKYANLLARSQAADKVFRDLTPLESGVADPEALEGWVRMVNGKVEMITLEMKRLQDKIILQDSRMQEIRDTHRLESTSQTELVVKLRSQLSTAESNLASRASELLQLGQLRSDLAKSQTTAKEEEEKRTKAISLLKTVRMKLVKLEKDKEEVERDRAEERAERSRAADDVERVKAEREREVNSLRKGFERETVAARERYDKELQTRKAAWELEMITTKATHAKELSNKATKVSGLELIVKELNSTKEEQFHAIQSRQEEVETSRAEMETLRNRTNELEFQLREANERCAILEESAPPSRSGEVDCDPSRDRDRGRSTLGIDLPDQLRAGVSRSPSRQSSYNGTSAAEVQRLLAEAESRSEAKLSDLRFKIRSLERERNEVEEEWGQKLQDRVHELEKLRRVIAEKDGEYADSLRRREEKEARIGEQQEATRALEREIKGLRAIAEEAKEDVAVAQDGERIAKDELSSVRQQLSTIQTQLEESRSQYATLKANNRTLRDELRKVQSSVQLMERSRNPGVGYWSATPTPGPAPNPGASSSTASTSANASGAETPIKGGSGGDKAERRSMESTATGTGRESVAGSEVREKDEEEVNLEYLRNVIIQFLEHKEMRPNLVRVLSVILRFTPQELRRLNAKISA